MGTKIQILWQLLLLQVDKNVENSGFSSAFNDFCLVFQRRNTV
jgi:hypothetical protein